MTHGETKNMLLLCNNIGQVDEILNKTYCKNDADKADYLQKIFDIETVHRTNHNAHTDYVALATAIVNHRVA